MALLNCVRGRILQITCSHLGKTSIGKKDVTDSSVIFYLAGAGSKKVDNGWNLVREQGSLTVQWYMDFKLRWYPWEKFSSLLFEKQYGTQMEIGLAKLKRLAENN